MVEPIYKELAIETGTLMGEVVAMVAFLWRGCVPKAFTLLYLNGSPLSPHIRYCVGKVVQNERKLANVGQDFRRGDGNFLFPCAQDDCSGEVVQRSYPRLALNPKRRRPPRLPAHSKGAS
jgi:hypothetical protein